MFKILLGLIGMITADLLLAKDISIGFSYAKPPYVFASQFEVVDIYAPQKDHLGIELDLVKAIFAKTDITLKPMFDTFHRIIRELDQGKLDAAETSGVEQRGIFYSNPLIGCENYAITKRSSGITINSIEDLNGKWLVAWQGAATDLGDRFQKIASNNPKYYESHDQQAQYKMFHAGRVDVIVIDKYIFKWWDAKYRKLEGKKEEYEYHPIFPDVNEYRIGFRSKEIRDLFDRGLRKIKQDGTYDKIMQHYITQMNI